MEYRYRVNGIVEKAFILRGAHFRVGSDIDTYITESELSFVQERCQLSEVVDTSVPKDPVPKTTKPRKKVEQYGV